MDVKTYDVGETVTITGTFKEEGTPGDPAVVRFIYKNPEGETTTLVYGTDTEITKDSTGVYSMELHLDMIGNWYYRVDDGETNVATERRLQVRVSNLIPIPIVP